LVYQQLEPDVDIDIGGNPGGDGIVIFVGLAAPPSSGALKYLQMMRIKD
jgi:hypothetical protein